MPAKDKRNPRENGFRKLASIIILRDLFLVFFIIFDFAQAAKAIYRRGKLGEENCERAGQCREEIMAELSAKISLDSAGNKRGCSWPHKLIWHATLHRVLV